MKQNRKYPIAWKISLVVCSILSLALWLTAFSKQTASAKFALADTPTVTETLALADTETVTQTPTEIEASTPTSTNTGTEAPSLTLTVTPTLIIIPTSTITPTLIPSLFHGPVNYAGGASWALAVGDFNHDGLQDAAMATISGNLLVYLQKNDGSLLSPLSYPVGDTAYFMATGDLNHDSRADIVISLHNLGMIGVFLQQPGGTLADMATYQTSSGSPTDVVVGDLNGDGLDDIAIANYAHTPNAIDIFTQHAEGFLNPKVAYPSPAFGFDLAIGDVNGDARNDLVATNETYFVPNVNPTIYLQNSDGVLALPSMLTCGNCGSAFSASIGDVTADGRDDIVASYNNGNHSNLAIFGQGREGAPVLYPVNTLPQSLKLSDVNKDGLIDVVTLNPPRRPLIDSSLRVYLAKNDGRLAAPLVYPLRIEYPLPQSLTVGDLNNDTWPDLVVATPRGLVVYYGGYDTILPATPMLAPASE